MTLWQRVRGFSWIFPATFTIPAQQNMELDFNYNNIITFEKNINLLFIHFYFFPPLQIE